MNTSLDERATIALEGIDASLKKLLAFAETTEARVVAGFKKALYESPLMAMAGMAAGAAARPAGPPPAEAQANLCVKHGVNAKPCPLCESEDRIEAEFGDDDGACGTDHER